MGNFLALLFTTDAKNANQNIIHNILGINTIKEAVYVVAMAVIISGLLRIILIWRQTKISHNIGHDWACDIFESTINTRYTSFLEIKTSEHVAVISNKITEVVLTSIISFWLLLGGLVYATAISIGVIISGGLTLTLSLIAVFLIIYVIIYRVTRPALDSYSKTQSLMLAKQIKVLIETFDSFKEVLIYKMQSNLYNNFSKIDFSLRNARANVQILGNYPRFLIETVAFFILLIGLSIYIDTEDKIIQLVPIIGVLLLAIQKMLPIIQSIYSSWNSINGNKNSLLDVLEALDNKRPKINNLNVNSELIVSFDKAIRLENVYFKYAKNDKYILINKNIEINKNEFIGISGGSGTGKTTLINIIIGLLEPTRGYLKIDDKIINIENQSFWWDKIAIVPQEPFIKDTTLRENITLNAISDNQSLDVAVKSSGLTSLVNKLPNGLDSQVGERGAYLSGGQRQRVAIARAIYKKAEVLILDEPSAALDKITENEIIKSIKQLSNLTVIMVSHSKEALQICDRVISLENKS